MRLERLTYEAADTLRRHPLYAANSVAVIEMERGDVRAKVQAELGRLSRCAVVSLDRFTPTATGGDGLYGTVGVVVSVFERPVTNRRNARRDAPAPQEEEQATIMNLAQAAANALDRAKCDGMNGPLYLDEITPIAELTEDGFQGVVTCDVVLTAKDLCITM